MNRYTVEITPGNGGQPYYMEFCAIDEAMVHTFMDDPRMRQYNGEDARLRIAYVLPWFPE